MNKPVKIRWVLAHDPIGLFLRAAKVFVKELEERAPGQLDFEVLTLSEYSEKYYNGKPVTKYDLLNLMEQGYLEMSQVYTTWLAERYNKNLNIIDMPFLFKDHDHAGRVFDGEIGTEMLAGIAASNKGVRGLAFTYSGGYRMIPSKTEIKSVADFKGKKVRVSMSPCAEDTFRLLGADPIKFPVEDIAEAVGEGRVEAGESTYARFFSLKQDTTCPVIVDARHNISATSIIVNDAFWASLPSHLQDILQGAAYASAKSERKEAVDDVDTVQAQALEQGVRVVKWTEEARSEFASATEELYQKYDSYFENNLLQRIRNA